jgi:hypothetical protein
VPAAVQLPAELCDPQQGSPSPPHLEQMPPDIVDVQIVPASVHESDPPTVGQQGWPARPQAHFPPVHVP